MNRYLRCLFALALIMFAVLIAGSVFAESITVYTGEGSRTGELCVNDCYVYVAFDNDDVAIASYIAKDSVADIAASFPDKNVIGIMSWAFTIKPNSYCGIEKYTVNGQRYECCTKVKKVIIPDTVRFIQDDAFDNNVIEDINIPSSLALMGHGAFANNKIAVLPELPDGCKLGNGAFYGSSAKTIAIPDSYTEISGMCFWASRANSYNISSTVKVIGEKAFSSSQVKKIDLPEGVTTIRDSAFEKCTNLSEITLPNTLTTIEQRAFVDCTALKSIIIPNGITKIEDQTFCGCKKLTSVSIPQSINYISDSAFAECPNTLSLTVIAGSYAAQWAEEHKIKTNIIVPVDAIELSSTRIILIKGKTFTLKGTVSPETASNKKVIWKTSDEKIATVNNGTIKGIANGECDILCKATDGSGVHAVCHVEVRTDVKRVAINEKQVTLLVGASAEYTTAKLTYTIAPEDAYWQDVTWTSSDEETVTVAADGTVKGRKSGKAIITALSTQPDSKAKAQATIIVQQAVTGIELDAGIINLEAGKKVAIKATVLPDNATNKKLEWTSSDENIATVNAQGCVTGISTGEAVITAKSIDGSEIMASCNVIVFQKTVE